jgi:hypothetical protein
MNGITRKDEWHYGERCESGSDMQGETGRDSARRQGEAGRQSEILSIDRVDHVGMQGAREQLSIVLELLARRGHSRHF